MMVICHSNRLESSTKPAEKPSTGLLVSSAQHQGQFSHTSACIKASCCKPSRWAELRSIDTGPLLYCIVQINMFIEAL